MKRFRDPRLLTLSLLLASIVVGSAAFGNWLPVIGTLPWLAAIAWFGFRDAGAAREFPSAAETARARLWTN